MLNNKIIIFYLKINRLKKLSAYIKGASTTFNQ